jgi:uncharacterized protein (TIGR00251 family)
VLGSTEAVSAIMVDVSEATIAVRAQPGARRDEFVGVREGVLVARVRAPASEGRANRALCQLIAGRLGVRATRVSVVRGERSRNKLIRVEGIQPGQLRAMLGLDG